MEYYFEILQLSYVLLASDLHFIEPFLLTNAFLT